MTEAICKKCSHYDKCVRQYYSNCPAYDPQDTEQTNEEWLKQCDTEQLADKLTDFSFWLVPTIPTEDKREQIRKKIVEWLKQPHGEENHE